MRTIYTSQCFHRILVGVRLACLGALLATSAIAGGDKLEISKVQDRNLIVLLNNFEVLSENVYPSFGTVRILSVPEQRECGDGASTCPKSRLLVAVSEIERPGFQGLFDLGESFGWTFLAWGAAVEDSQTGSSEGGYVLPFRLERRTLSPGSRRFKTEICDIQVNPWLASGSCM
jgi:hypothetical protein